MVAILYHIGFETILPSYTVKQMAQGVGHLNSFSDQGDRNSTAEKKKNSNAQGCAQGRRGGMLKLQIDRCIIALHQSKNPCSGKGLTLETQLNKSS